MTHLFHLDSSPRAAGFSRQIGAAYARAWRAANPGGRYTYRDLTAEPVPFIDEAWTEICDYALENEITDPERLSEGARTVRQKAAWAVVEPLLNDLVSADVVLMGVPMHNFSVPACLKAWIDQVTFPRAAIRARVVVAGARGGTYVPGSPRHPFDHQERYLRDFFKGHFAVDDITFVTAELTNARVDPYLGARRKDFEASVRDALKTAGGLAS
ncbi:FMN-dependent NADH-azoreductase [Paractinoplanes rhizophilus]|jgi:FMN-dependent NADH-azoreductase|uniref:FMN dependent NADH:quinone oxidoreductase n=1 Tax=Paractinoplanes rhizophilus TaxID=1416877 RepID=A0ABW2I5E6_9ACTN|nr:NAD(P)H-dependent oxidoreductase [Actinoplanes sp.]